MELEDYLVRLELQGAPSVDADGLRLLQERHLLRVPFENVDVVEGIALEASLPALFDKIVRRRRGGICYELNGLFAWLLREIGFTVELLEARVPRKDGEPIAFDHLVLRVPLEGEAWLVDVGFGTGYLRPLKLSESGDQQQFRDRYRLVDDAEEGWRAVEARSVGRLGARQLYRFSEQPREFSDFAPGLDFHSKDPASPFTPQLVCHLAIPDGRVSLVESELRLDRGGRVEASAIDEASLAASLRRHFGILA